MLVQYISVDEMFHNSAIVHLDIRVVFLEGQQTRSVKITWLKKIHTIA